MDGYLGQIILFAGSYAPEGWMICDGSTLTVASNPALFSLVGTTYGGDGASTFRIPDLRGRVPLGSGQGAAHGGTPATSNRPLGGAGGTETVSLTTANIPPHTHALNVSGAAATSTGPAGNLLAVVPTGQAAYFNPPAGTTVDTATLGGAAVSTVGANAPHDNMMPSVAINYLICVDGVYPSRAS